MSILPYLVCAWLFLVGIYGVATSRNLIHMIICLLVMQSSTYVLFLSGGYVTGGRAPVYANVAPGTKAVDPVVHALSLTDIVVATTVTGLLLAMTIQIYKERRTIDPEELRPLRNRG